MSRKRRQRSPRFSKISPAHLRRSLKIRNSTLPLAVEKPRALALFLTLFATLGQSLVWKNAGLAFRNRVNHDLFPLCREKIKKK